MTIHGAIPAVLKSLASDLHGGSLVLLDEGSADAIACAAGFPLLSSLGVVGVANLNLTDGDLETTICASSALAGGQLTTVTAFVSTTLGQAEQQLYAAAVAASTYTQRFVIACGVSEAAHHDEDESRYSSTCYAEYETRFIHQIAQTAPEFASHEVRITFAPLPLVPLSETAFVLPAGSAAASARASGLLLGLGGRAIDDDDASSQASGAIFVPPRMETAMPPSTTQGVAVLAHALSNVAAAIGVHPEAFCLGPAAQEVGKALSFVPPAPPPGGGTPSATPAAFVLVDRAADLVTPGTHADLLLARVWDVLTTAGIETALASSSSAAAATGKHSDDSTLQYNMAPALQSAQIRVPMRVDRSERSQQNVEAASSSSPRQSPIQDAGCMLAGSLFHPADATATANLGFLLSRKGRDAAMFVRKWLREAVRHEGVRMTGRASKPGGVSAQELRALASALAQTPAIAHRNASLLQLAEAAAIALEEAPSGRWDSLAMAERALVATCDEGNQESVFEQLMDIFATAGRGGPVGLLEASTLLLIACSLLPDRLPWFAGGGGDDTSAAFTPDQEARLCAALAEAVLACAERWCQDERAEGHGRGDRVIALDIAAREAPWLPRELREQLIKQAAQAVQISSDKTRTTTDELEAEQDHDDDDDDVIGRRALTLRLRDASVDLFSRLRLLSQTRRKAFGGPDLTHSDQQGGTPPCLVARLAAAAIEDAEIPGLVAASTSLAGLLRSGLGRMGIQRKCRLGQYQTIVIFVIGGLSLVEAHEALAIANAKLAAVGPAGGVKKMPEGAGGPSPAFPGGGGDGGGPNIEQRRVLIGGSVLLQPGDATASALQSLSW